MAATTRSTSQGATPELVITRVFDAPRERVFQVWTEAKHFARWFGPTGAEMPHCTLDARVGGTIRFCHRLPDGMEAWGQGTFDEVLAPQRLAFTATFVDAAGRPVAPPVVPDWPVGTVFVVSVVLAPHPQGTHLTVRQSVMPATAAALEAVRSWTANAALGWGQTLDRLGRLLAELGDPA